MAVVGLDNPMGTQGFALVEFAAGDSRALEPVFESLGFREVGRHRTRALTLWRQGGIDFLLNTSPGGPAAAFAREHGPSAFGVGFRVADAAAALARALSLGARRFDGAALDAPALVGVGGSALYLVDQDPYAAFDLDAAPVPGVGLQAIDHLTHNLRQGEMAVWSEFYGRIFNFREIRSFEIEGRVTGLHSQALASPDGAIRIPLNESAGGDQLDQVEEFIRDYRGEGVQHIALATADAYATVEQLRARGVAFQDAPPDTYYDMLSERLGDHGEDEARLRAAGLLLDGSRDRRLLLQIFTQPCIGPIFFEIIQRKGDEGFGAGNFQALFESIERDQIRRGVIDAPTAA
jgi:4-hydroxyphenylpyruvate dioxygenase